MRFDLVVIGAGSPGARVASATALDRFIRAKATNYSHPVGTCATGAADYPSAVVGADGRVHGLTNVFAADASVLRRILRANTNFSCFLIGWRAGMRLGRRR
jgi:choline dehydrogenase